MKIIPLTLFLLIQIGLFAQEEYQVHLRGKIYSEQTKGVRDFFRGVEIELTKNDQPVYKMVSDSIGGFEFYADIDGIWTLKVKKKDSTPNGLNLTSVTSQKKKKRVAF